MVELNLIANDEQERKILAYLQENASDVLADKINNGTPFEKDGHPLTNKKTLSGFVKYACDEAQKLASNGARSAFVDDKVVYGWAIHYFEEDSIEGTLYTIDGEEYKPTPKKVERSVPKTKKQPPKQENLQFSLFDKITEPEVKNTETTTLSTESEVKEIVPEVKTNPLWSKYQSYQAEHTTAVVAYRLGDFYEVFGEYAVLVSNELELTLTGRDFGLESRVPMVGFPYHVAQNYFDKITNNHDLYVIENDTDKQFITKREIADNRLIDEDTGELFDLSEEEMKEFDGDVYEPKEPIEEEPTDSLTELAKSIDKELMIYLYELLDEKMTIA